MESVVQLISSVGFPIVACLFLWKYINDTLKEFSKVINENTRMLNKICDKLDILEDKQQ